MDDPQDLTDRQFTQVYCHPRDKDGSLVKPHPELVGDKGTGNGFVSLDEELAQLEVLIRANKPDNAEELRAQVRKEWGQNGVG